MVWQSRDIGDRMKKLIFFLLVIIIILILVSCQPELGGIEKTDNGGFSYEIVEIEGMPCIWYKEATGYRGHAGLTCDWSKYGGRWHEYEQMW